MKKYINLLLAAIVVALTMTSCDDYLDVNRNEDAPDYVDAYLYLAGIQQQYQGLYWDIRAAGPLTQMMGTTSYTNFANHYYTAGSDAGGEIWRMVYWNQGMNLENLINQSEEAENWTLAGIGYAMKAYSWDAMTKYHGELPMKQAFVPGLLSHEYDYQEDIYAQVIEWAEKAIELLQKEDATNYGTKISSTDFIYGGNKDRWIKFAYAVIVRNLASLTNKKDFQSKYYSKLVEAAGKSFASNADNALLSITAGGKDAPYSGYNNWWGTTRGNMTRVYYPHEYAVEIMTGRIPKYDENGNWIAVENQDVANLRYEISENQIICDTLEETGHFDPRPLVKFGTKSGRYKVGDDIPEGYQVGDLLKANETDLNKLKKYVFFAGTFTGTSSSFLNNSAIDPARANDANVCSFYNTPYATSTINENNVGEGRWIYRNNAPYILATYPEILFDLAEAQFKVGDKAAALETWKKAVAADLEFTASFIVEGKPIINGKITRNVPAKYDEDGNLIEDAKTVEIDNVTGYEGDIVNRADFNTLAAEYLAGPYVNGLSLNDFTLSHIMMQKFAHLFPWGALEEWVDQRKYFYDIDFTGEYPEYDNGWDLTAVYQKMDSDPTKVYKGFYLAPAQVQGRKGTYNTINNGSPCFRIRPRYNSEYMWNKPSLKDLTPISGLADNYQCSIPWFAYPGDQPTKVKEK
ncbi:MAG: SusD/RagB family nutrient-binding outer membrane lipoprotein [Muribaculaceae bacterium]|nr:SusD/RagB family nutrient-binding outer membrane lipoprotein [Muribaculaceae bacterium]